MSEFQETTAWIDETLPADEGDVLASEVRVTDPPETLSESERRLLCDGEGGSAPPK